MMTDKQREATEWLVRIQDESATTEDFNAWQQWLAESPENRRAFRTLEDLWENIGESAVRPWPSVRELSSDRYTGEVPLHQWLSRQRPGYPFIALALAAALAVITVAGFRMDSIRQLWRGPATQIATVQTERAEDREISLRDGSQLTVGAESLVNVEITEAARNVVLESGVAYFEVAQDARRPFVVRAGEGVITALGTAFNVRHVGERTVVTVTEGKVKVVAAPVGGAGQASETILSAGHQLSYGSRMQPLLTSPDPTIATAWRGGRLKYLDEPLKFVVPDVTRYARRQITIEDPAIGELRYTGTVMPAEIDDWLKSLARTFPVEVRHVADDEVRLSARR
jgi:transmembrane sensor